MATRKVTQTKQQRKLHVWADSFGFTHHDRRAFAEYMLRRDVSSWTTLTDEEVLRLLDGFEGGHMIVELLMQRGAISVAE